MDRGAGDGADSAEDSGSSQSYPSTLPGIPKVHMVSVPFIYKDYHRVGVGAVCLFLS